MPRRLEKNDFTTPQAIAAEAVAALFLAWKLKDKYYRKGTPEYYQRDDTPSEPEPSPYPMNESIGDTDVYLYPGTETEPFVLGSRNPSEGYTEVHAMIEDNGTDKPKVTVDESRLDSDPSRLKILRDRVTEIHQAWSSRVGD